MWLRLATKWGKPVSQCQGELTSAEFAELIAFNNIEPFLINRSEYAIAVLGSFIADIVYKNNKLTPEDFLIQKKKKVDNPLMIQKHFEALYGGNK